MLYPRIYDLIAECRRLGVDSNVALSGYGIDERSLGRLTDSGVTGIFVSLNGSTDAVNARTRNGYRLALNALELLKKNAFPNVAVNFVVHGSNCDDFPGMVSLCERYRVRKLVVMAAKPAAAEEMCTPPSREQSLRLADEIREAARSGSVKISVENCYSPLRAYLGRSFLFENTNRGLYKGCMAGKISVSLDVDGRFTPCRHILEAERFETIGEYWLRSPALAELRQAKSSSEETCGGCSLSPYCLRCPAVIAQAATTVLNVYPCAFYQSEKGGD
jgi:pyrroloquinoline quinone biosynthesis protein E